MGVTLRQIKGITQDEGVGEYIWGKQVGLNMKMERIAQ